MSALAGVRRAVFGLLALSCVERLDLSVRGADAPVDDARERCAQGATRPCFAAPERFATIGACRRGTERCGADGRWAGACEGEVLPAPEVCNLVDDDCDGEVDELSAYEPDETVAVEQAGESLTSVVSFARSLHGPSSVAGASFETVLAWASGVGAANCTDTLHLELFDDEGRRVAPFTVRSMPAMPAVALAVREDSVEAASEAQGYAQRSCGPPIDAGVCPVVTARLRPEGESSRSWTGSLCGVAERVETDTGFLFARQVSDEGDRRHYELYAVRQGAVEVLPGELSFPLSVDAVPDAGTLAARRDGSRIVWLLLTSDGATALRVTDLAGVALPESPDVVTALTTGFGALTGATVADGALFVVLERSGDKLSSRLVRIAIRDGSVEGEWPLGAYSGVDVAASRDGRQLYLCGGGFGLSFMRYSLHGRPMQGPVALDARLSRTRGCRVTSVARGALVAWSQNLDGVARWTRVGCPAR